MAAAVHEALFVPGISQPPLSPANVTETQRTGSLGWAFRDDED